MNTRDQFPLGLSLDNSTFIIDSSYHLVEDVKIQHYIKDDIKEGLEELELVGEIIENG